jgi:hypothetical protein
MPYIVGATTVIPAVGVAIGWALSSGSSSAPAAAAALASASATAQAPSASSTIPAADVAGCTTLEGATWNVTNATEVGLTQDVINGVLDQLPHGQQLNTDLLAAETPLVEVDDGLIDLAERPTDYAQYVAAFEAGLRQVETDCAAYGVSFSVNLTSLPTGAA